MYTVHLLSFQIKGADDSIEDVTSLTPEPKYHEMYKKIILVLLFLPVHIPSYSLPSLSYF